MARTESTMLDLGTIAPDFALPEVVTGKTVRRDDFKGKQGLLVMFICAHCPFVKHVNQGLAAFGKDYAGTALAMVAISSNDAETHPADSPAGLKQQAQTFGFVFPYSYDADFSLVYRGQFDSSRPDSGIPVTGKDLRAAVDLLLAGRTVPKDQHPSIGCNIKWKA